MNDGITEDTNDDLIPAARLFKALAHPARLAILDVLRREEQCVCHIEAVLGYRQAYISQQLILLREAELVADRKVGWNNYYRVTRPEIFDLIDRARRITGFPESTGDSPERPASCPCPKCAPIPAGKAG